MDKRTDAGGYRHECSFLVTKFGSCTEYDARIGDHLPGEKGYRLDLGMAARAVFHPAARFRALFVFRAKLQEEPAFRMEGD